jgi:acyl-coenzyme A thioesterase PaaI-like protein
MGAARAGEGWSFEFPTELMGAFGGAFGGAVCAAALIAARAEVPGRAPAGLDIQFLRALPPGSATAVASVIRPGRSLTATSVDVTGADGKLASRATITMVDPSALDDRDTDGRPPEPVRSAQEWANPGNVRAPILDTLQPRIGLAADGSVATTITVPWDDVAAAAEAACFAADLCVGPPVARGMADRWVPHPNPDVSIRFLPVAQEGRELTGYCRLERIGGGVAVQTLTVHGADGIVATGTSMSLLLPAR